MVGESMVGESTVGRRASMLPYHPARDGYPSMLETDDHECIRSWERRLSMGAPSPELCNLWLARAFNAQDAEAAAAMYHPEAAIVQVDEVHGGTTIARGADGIRRTMAAYIGLKPHMDVTTHHTTVAGDFAMTRSQWLIKGV